MVFLSFFVVFTILTFIWLLFNLAVFALPFFVGLTAATWAYHTGAGWVGAGLAGLLAGVLTFSLGQLLFFTLRPTWVRILILAAFVVPAAIAGFHATHGFLKHMIPSETWQSVFSVIGAIAAGAVALMRLTTMVVPVSSV
ncbi:MAG: hypothetical protein FWD68_01830 [Alphaproteobacteria bacterium]|nr:hypothetical protein [Alphaproteobacteria bacterium]